MKRSEIIELARYMASNAINLYLEETEMGVFGVLCEDVKIIGFYEDEQSNQYIMTFMVSDYRDILCGIDYELDTKRFRSNVYSKINLVEE